MRVLTKGLLLLLPIAVCLPVAPGAGSQLGIFQERSDVGTVLHAGSAELDASKRTYSITGSGENMWSTSDALHLVWKKVSGDLALTADVSFVGTGGDPHRKAVLIMRQSLDADSAYADAALHGDGLTSLQARDEKGAVTREIQARVKAPRRLRLTKRGQYFYMSIAGEGESFKPAGGWMRVPLEEPFYVGIGVCAHNKDAIETARFTNVEVKALKAEGKTALHSTLETITVSSTDRRVAYVTPGRIGAPNWTRDGSLIFTSEGRLQHLSIATGKPQPIDTGFAVRCNGNHGISPDGALLAITDQSQEDGSSLIYTVPVGGGTPRRATRQAPSYWHGWSPDGRTLLYSAKRDGRNDLFSTPTEGGVETRLTSTGFNDGPEFTPDGSSIYFNSDRSGSMQIWRMRPDGSNTEQVTSDDFNNWFPHVSPDGGSIAFVSFPKGVAGCPEDKEVRLRMLTLADGKVKLLAKLVGGRGTMDAPSWSPDSRQLAFVSYQFIPE